MVFLVEIQIINHNKMKIGCIKNKVLIPCFLFQWFWINNTLKKSTFWILYAKCFSQLPKNKMNLLKKTDRIIHILLLYCLRNRTTLRFDFLHSFMVCRQTSTFWYRESWNFRISTAHAYKYKTKLQPKIKRRENKNDILLASHQSTYVPEKHRFAYRP